MDSNNYVAPVDGGYVVVVDGRQIGGTYSDLNQAQDQYNQSKGSTVQPSTQPTAPSGGGSTVYQTREGPKTVDQMRRELIAAGGSPPSDPNAVFQMYQNIGGGGGAGAGAGAGYEWWNPQLTQMQFQAVAQEAQLAYQRERMKLIDIPMLEIERERLALQAAEQAAQAKMEELKIGLGVLDLAASLRGPRNAFTQQQVLHGINEQGLSRAVDAIAGRITLPTTQAPQAQAQPATLQNFLADIYAAAGLTPPFGIGGSQIIPPASQWASQLTGAWDQLKAGGANPGEADWIRMFSQFSGMDANVAKQMYDRTNAWMGANGWQRPPDALRDQWLREIVAGGTGATAPAGQMTNEAAGTQAGTPYAMTSPTTNLNTVTAPSFREPTDIDRAYNDAYSQAQQAAKGYSDMMFRYAPAGWQPGSPINLGGATAAPSTPTTSVDAYTQALVAPNKIVGREYVKLPGATQQFLLGGYEAGGHSGDDVEYAIKQGLPQFRAPSVATVR